MATKITISQAQEQWLKHCEAMRSSEGTIKAYRAAVDCLLKVTGDIYTLHVTQAHVDQVFLSHNWSPNSRNNRLSQLRTFFAFCRNRRYMLRDSDPTFGYRKLKIARPDALRIPVTEWARLFDATRNTQELIVLATGLYLFLRASEQKRIQLKHVHLDTQEIEVFRVKTQDWDRMPISLELDGYIRTHLTTVSQSYKLTPESYLCPARIASQERDANSHFTGALILDPSRPVNIPHRVVQNVLARAGYLIEKQGEHTLRRSGARAYFDSLVSTGYDGALRRVQSMLGHELASTTETYLGLHLDRHARNKDLRGQFMFPQLQTAKVVPIRKESK